MTRGIKHTEEDKENSVLEAVGYLRVSTKSQEDGVSLRVQEKTIMDYCDNPLNKCTLKKVFKDVGKSAYNQKARDGFKGALEYIKLGGAKILIVYSLSRGFRDTQEAVNTSAFLKEYDAHFISATQKELDTTTRYGRIYFVIMAAVAELESEMKSQRVRDAMIEKFSATGFVGSHKPMGYQFYKEEVMITKNRQTKPFDKVTWPYYIKEDNGEREIVETVFKLYAEGVTQQKIRDIITDMKRVKAKKEGEDPDKIKRMSGSVVSRMLSNPLYCGLLMWIPKKREAIIMQGKHEKYITIEEYNANVDRRIKNIKNGYHSTHITPFYIKLDKDKEPYIDWIKVDKKNK